MHIALSEWEVEKQYWAVRLCTKSYEKKFEK